MPFREPPRRLQPSFRPRLEMLEDRCLLNTDPVTVGGDSGMAGQLRQVLAGASAGDTIVFQLATPTTITLQSGGGFGTLILNKNITIQGPGANLLTVSGPATNSFSIFAVNAGISATISGLTISAGFGSRGTGSVNGGGIFNAGTLTLQNSTISGNSSNKNGGGIYNSGAAATLQVYGSTIANNIGNKNFYSGAGGGGISNHGGSLHLYSSTISGNKLYAGYASGHVAYGGGIDNTGTATVQNSTLTGNQLHYYGVSGGGGATNRGAGSTLSIVNSTIQGNLALGDYNHYGTHRKSYGGGLEALAGTLTLTNSTVSGNTAIIGGGLYVKAGATARLYNSLIAGNNFFQTGYNADVSGAITTAGNNLIGDGTGSSGVTNGVNGNLVGNHITPINPLLAPLGSNGGSTQTMALLPGSPAIDAGSSTFAPATDQRGVPRPQGAAPDIGAFESRGFMLTSAGGSNQQTLVNTAFATPLSVTVSSPFGEPVAGGIVTFTSPPTGPSATLSSGTAIINGDGQASITSTANGTAGSYAETASASGASAVAFNLTNTVPAPPPPPPAPGIIAVGIDAGGSPVVNVYDATTGILKAVFYAFAPSFTGGVRVAVADVNGDGVPDIICGAGPGGGPQVTVFDGVSFSPISSFFALPAAFSGGVYVSAVVVNGTTDIVCGAGPGGGPEVAVYSGKTGSLLSAFYAFAPSFTGGVSVAGALASGGPEIICAAGPGGGPQVVVFNAATLASLAGFFAFAPNFTGGVYVTAGDVNGDGVPDIICGAGAGGGPQVAIFNGVNDSQWGSFFALPAGFTGGVRVGFSNAYGSAGKPAILAAAGPGAGPQVTAFDASTLADLSSFFAFDYSIRNGLFISG